MPRNPGGRPEVGPKVELRLPAETLSRVDADANRQQISRARWLRDAVHEALPYDCLTPHGRHAMTAALANIDSLADYRAEALDPEVPVEDRAIESIQYADTVHEMRVLLGTLRDALPTRETRDAHMTAKGTDPGMTTAESAKAWAQNAAAERLYAILDAVGQLLPVDGNSVRDRASLDDPTADLD